MSGSEPLPTADKEAAGPSAEAGKSGYGRILKTSAMICGSSFVSLGIAVMRTKAMALMLGPAGFGLMGLFSALADLAKNIATLGINASGVRQVAEAAGSGDNERIARTATVLRRISVLLGIFGAMLLAVCAGPLSVLTFGSVERTGEIALLALAVFFGCVSAGQGALIQGMRRIADQAKMNILSATAGTAIGIPMVFYFGESGVVPSLIAVAATGMIASWWYMRKIRVPARSMSVPDMGRETSALLKLGFAFLASTLMMTGAAYAVRLILMHESGIEAAGLYQSAWALGGLYVGFILDAMGTDFYPRLTGAATNNKLCNEMVNEQAKVSLLLAGPGVIATLTFAPLVIALFYSPKFYAAVETLRWICFGMAIRVVVWPIGFVIPAKGAQRLFFAAEALWTVSYLALAWAGVKLVGPVGAGVAFFVSQILHGLIVYYIVRGLSGFRWSRANRRMGLLFLSLPALVLGGFYLLPPLLGEVAGALAALASGAYSVRTLAHLVPPERIPAPILRWLARLRLAPRPNNP